MEIREWRGTCLKLRLRLSLSLSLSVPPRPLSPSPLRPFAPSPMRLLLQWIPDHLAPGGDFRNDHPSPRLRVASYCFFADTPLPRYKISSPFRRFHVSGFLATWCQSTVLHKSFNAVSRGNAISQALSSLDAFRMLAVRQSSPS